MDKSIRFWDRIANKYAKQPIAEPDAYHKKLELTQQYLTPSSSVLEFGCGTGSTALTHAVKVKNIVAIDSSGKMIDIANRKVQESGPKNVEFIKATLFDLPHKSESFDAVLGLNVLHLIDDMDAAIKKSFDLLKPGGVFVTSTVCIAESASFLKFILPIGSKLGLIPSVKVFDIETLENSITRVGFKVLKNLVPGKDKGVCFIVAQK